MLTKLNLTPSNKGFLFSFLCLCLLLSLLGCNATTPQATNHPAASNGTHPGEVVLAAPRDLAPGQEDAYYTSTILYVWEPLITAKGTFKPSCCLLSAISCSVGSLTPPWLKASTAGSPGEATLKTNAMIVIPRTTGKAAISLRRR
jgi:hypothetical protein